MSSVVRRVNKDTLPDFVRGTGNSAKYPKSDNFCSSIQNICSGICVQLNTLTENRNEKVLRKYCYIRV